MVPRIELTRGSCLALATVVLTACATGVALTDGGHTVTRVTDADKPDGCRLIGDVAIGIPPDAAQPRTEDELVMLMRNKTSDMGGTHVVVDMSEERNAGTERPNWVGRGRAYDCPPPEEPEPPPIAPEETAGGESADEDGPTDEGGDEAGGDGSAGESGSAADDALIEDLLGE